MKKEFTINTNQEIKSLDMLFEYHQLMTSFKLKKKSIKILFKSSDNEYWIIIGKIKKEEINKTGTLFGLKL